MHRASIDHGVLGFTSQRRCLQQKQHTDSMDSRGSSLEKRVCQRCGRRVRESAPASQEVGQRPAEVERCHGAAVGESDEDPLVANLIRQTPRKMVEHGLRRKPDTNIVAGHRVGPDLPGNNDYPPTPVGHRSVGG